MSATREGEKLTDEERKLAERYMPYARRIAQRFADKYRLDREEVEAEAFIQMIFLIQEYRSERGASLVTHIGNWLFSRLVSWFRDGSELGIKRHGIDTLRQANEPIPQVYRASDGNSLDVELYSMPIDMEVDQQICIDSMLDRLKKSTGKHWPAVESLLGWITCEEAGKRMGGITVGAASLVRKKLVAHFGSMDWLREELTDGR